MRVPLTLCSIQYVKIMMDKTHVLFIFLQLVIHIERSQASSMLCPPHYLHYPSGRTCFRYEHHTKMNQDGAQKMCLEEGARLAYLKDAESSKFVRDNRNIAITGGGESYWLGADLKTGVWKWFDGDVMEYTDWRPTEPNNPSKELCLELSFYSHSMGWNDRQCDAKLGYICERPEGVSDDCSLDNQTFVLRNEKCYWSKNSMTSFFGAKDYCNSTGGRVLTNANQELHEHLKFKTTEYPVNQTLLWLDLTKIKGNWTYTDGSVFEGHFEKSSRIFQDHETCSLADLSDEKFKYRQDGCSYVSGHAVCESYSGVYPIIHCPIGYAIIHLTSSYTQCVRFEMTTKMTLEEAKEQCHLEGSSLLHTDYVNAVKPYFQLQNTFWIRADYSGYSIYVHYCISYNAHGVSFDNYCTSLNKYYFVCSHKPRIALKADVSKMMSDKQRGVDYNVTSLNSIETYFPAPYSRFPKLNTNSSWLLETRFPDSLSAAESSPCAGINDTQADKLHECCVELHWHFDNSNSDCFGIIGTLDCFDSIKIEPVTKTSIKLLKNLTSTKLDNGKLANKMCPCACGIPKFDLNPSPTVLLQILGKIQKELKVEKSSVSAVKSKKESQMYDSVETRSIGLVYLGVCSIPFIFIVIADLCTCLRHVVHRGGQSIPAN